MNTCNRPSYCLCTIYVRVGVMSGRGTTCWLPYGGRSLSTLRLLQVEGLGALVADKPYPSMEGVALCLEAVMSCRDHSF